MSSRIIPGWQLSASKTGCAYRVFVRPKEVCTLCTPLCAGGFSTCILIPSPWFCLHRFMQFSVAGGMTLRPGSSVSLDVPVSGTSLGSWVRSVDGVQVCGIRAFFRAVRVWLGPTCPYRDVGPFTCLSEPALQRPSNGRRHAGVDDRKRPADQRRFGHTERVPQAQGCGRHQGRPCVVGHVRLVSHFYDSEPIGPCRSMNTARFAMFGYPRLSNTNVAWMRSPPPIPLLPLLAVVIVWSR